jgi:uncharacterized protein (TIGR02996 family)
MSDDFSFLRAIFRRPADDGLRLVYADWLEERGDPRAGYVRLDVELRRAVGSRTPAAEEQLRDLAPGLDARWVRWMWHTRHLPPGARLDLVHRTDGPGRIEVRGGENETVLLVDGRPVALNWNDCQGSVGQYLVFTGHTGGSVYARQLAEFAADGVEDDRPLADQIAPLLAVFARGTYCLHYVPSAVIGNVTTLGDPGRSSAGRELIEYYPIDDRNLVATQARESLNEDRVAFFREQIRAGRRPTVLTASAEGAWCEFVIDGHHKLEAYNRERVNPAVLNIVRWDAPEISLEEGLRYLPRRHPGVTEYRRMKRLEAG